MAQADRRVAVPDSDRQYHIDAAAGDIAEYILLPGDQDRTSKVTALFDSVEYEHRHREFATATGMYKGRRLSCISTGIGTDNVEIVIAEILAITKHPTFIRIGSCGVLREEIDVGDLVITTGAVRLEGTTKFYVTDGYPAVADYQAVSASGRGGAPAQLPRAPGHHCYLAQLLRRPGPADSADSHPLAGPRRRDGAPGCGQLRDGGFGSAGARRIGRMPCGRRVHGVRSACQRRFRRRKPAKTR